MADEILVERWQRLAGILTEQDEQSEFVVPPEESAREEKTPEVKVNEAQFATDPLKRIDTDWQPKEGEDYEPEEGEPMMVGSVQDEEFNLDDFDFEEEGLTVREPGMDADPEYAEDGLGDLYGLSWEEAEERNEKERWSRGGPVIRDTDIGRKS